MLPVSISGTVTKFKGDGRKLGYPTANISTTTDLQDGVYFGYADMAEFKNHPAMIFVGVPTTMGETERRVEAYLFDIPDKDYYGENISLQVEKFHRGNHTFSSVDELISVIKEDETAARQWFAESSSGSAQL